MVEVIGVKFRSDGRIYSFDPKGEKYEQGKYVIVTTSRGTEIGEVASENHNVPDSQIVGELKPVVRLADSNDLAKMNENRKKEREAFRFCENKIIERGLEMKLVDVEYAFDGSKLLFFFTADGRVDFRELVKDLAGNFHTRIELRQIGVRDEAKMMGGLGICGQPFCCSRFLSDFQPVSIKMAKEQGLSLNPAKISGTCGRLMCCLKYEQDAYEYLDKLTPKVGSYVETPDGKGIVAEVSILTGRVKVALDGSDGLPIAFHRDDITVITRGNGKRPKPQPKEE
jgi:cell fate regulator YaaT (PSP1 superfamily)